MTKLVESMTTALESPEMDNFLNITTRSKIIKKKLVKSQSEAIMDEDNSEVVTTALPAPGKSAEFTSAGIDVPASVSWYKEQEEECAMQCSLLVSSFC